MHRIMSSLDFYLQNKDGADKFAILYNREKRYNYDVLLFASFGRIYLLDGQMIRKSPASLKIAAKALSDEDD